MKTTIEFNDDEKFEANVSQNVTRIIRVLDNVWDYAVENNDTILMDIIEDYLNMKEI